MNKLNDLVSWFEDKDKVMIALSGGVDSAVVAYAAFQALGSSAIAVTADYKTLSEDELLSAKQVCSEIGIEQILLDYSELENEEFVKNDSNRCFHCRMELGDHLIELAKKHNVKIIVDKKSFLYLVGTTLEYSGGLNGKGFVFNNPNANRTCGCGESFSL